MSDWAFALSGNDPHSGDQTLAHTLMAEVNQQIGVESSHLFSRAPVEQLTADKYAHLTAIDSYQPVSIWQVSVGNSF